MASESLFHERQSLLNCAVHCLNNLYQQRWVDAAAMDALADRVAAENQASSWWNPYRSVLPRVGNYDVTVIVEALKQQDGSLAMHLLNNKHMNADLEALKQVLGEEAAECIGVIVNRETTNPIRRLLDGRHWLAVIRDPRSGRYVNLDSKLDVPLYIGDIDSLVDYLRTLMLQHSGQIFLVKRQTAAAGRTALQT